MGERRESLRGVRRDGAGVPEGPTKRRSVYLTSRSRRGGGSVPVPDCRISSNPQIENRRIPKTRKNRADATFTTKAESAEHQEPCAEHRELCAESQVPTAGCRAMI